MYISSVCIKVKRFSYKNVWFLNYQRAGVSFSTFLVLCYNQLSTFDLYCLLDLFVLSLLLFSCIILDLSYLGMNRGHLFHILNQLLQSIIGALGWIFALSRVNKIQEMSLLEFDRSWTLTIPHGKICFCNLSLEVHKVDLFLSSSSLLPECFVLNWESDSRREFSRSMFGASA